MIEARPDALVVEGLSRHYGSLAAVSGVTLRVMPGERRVVLGPNGAGKTTLFNMIAGDTPPSAGRIHLNGEDVTELDPAARCRRGVRRTYQTSLLFDGLTVLENLAVAVRGARGGTPSLRRPPAADRIAAAHLAGRLGLERIVDEPVSVLSHGQRRQLELAMALAGEPTLILLDEPAAGLSTAERGALGALLRGLPRSVTVLLIEHDMDVAFATADRVTVMDNGRVIADGTPAEILNDPHVHAVYVGGGDDFAHAS